MFNVLDYNNKHYAQYVCKNIGKGKRSAEHQPGKSRMLPAQQIDEVKILRDLHQNSKDQNAAGGLKYRRVYKAFNDTINKDHYQKIAAVRSDDRIVKIGADDKFDH